LKKFFACLTLVGTMLLSASSSYAAANESVLRLGETLQKGQHLVSPNGQYFLEMQTDGNLVLYGRGTALWNTQTGGNPNVKYAQLQIAGYFVLMGDNGYTYWAAQNRNYAQAYFLNLQDDGNLVLYTPYYDSHDHLIGYAPVWDTATYVH
jgi:hypothetical protein